MPTVSLRKSGSSSPARDNQSRTDDDYKGDGLKTISFWRSRFDALAEKLRVTRQTIISIEKGKYDPSLELAFKMARLFGVKIEDIFDYRSGETIRTENTPGA